MSNPKRPTMTEGGFVLQIVPCQDPKIKRLAYLWVGTKGGDHLATFSNLAKLHKMLGDFLKAKSGQASDE